MPHTELVMFRGAELRDLNVRFVASKPDWRPAGAELRLGIGRDTLRAAANVVKVERRPREASYTVCPRSERVRPLQAVQAHPLARTVHPANPTA